MSTSSNILFLGNILSYLLLVSQVDSFSSVSRSSRLPKNVRIRSIRENGDNAFTLASRTGGQFCHGKRMAKFRETCTKLFAEDGDHDYEDDEEDLTYGKYEVDSDVSFRQEETVPSLSKDAQYQIEQQQKQINMLMEMVKNQPQLQQMQQQERPQQIQQERPQQIQQAPQQQFQQKSQQQMHTQMESPQPMQTFGGNLSTNFNGRDEFLPSPLPGMFDYEGEEELLDHSEESFNTITTSQTEAPAAISQPQSQLPIASSNNVQAQNGNLGGVAVAPMKAMLFIDGTWLYYSLHRRKEERDPIVKKFGKGWQYRYRFDWNALPRIVCEEIVGQQINLGWSSAGTEANAQNNAQRPVEVVRASVFTSYKKTTDPKSFRAKMYNEMADANYDIHMLESTSNGPEKCVDISLAVEMLHYATVPNAYDVAILLSGDKDFIPAMVRTRQKGRKVGVVSMRTGCNRALYESSHVKDFDVVWIDDFLDRLLVPLPPDQVGKNVQSVHDRGLLSAFTITKVILDFVSQSPYGKVSSRDVGRYLKNLELPGGTSLLDDVKLGQGGLRRFLQERVSEIFEVIDRPRVPRDPNDRSYWIVQKGDAKKILLDEAKRSNFTPEEKQFLQDYQSGAIDRGVEEEIYHYTIEAMESESPSNYGEVPNMPNVMQYHQPYEEEKEEVDYSTWTVVNLKELCREKQLPVSGTKAVLIERIQKAEGEEADKIVHESSSRASGLSNKDSLEKYLVDLVKYYIVESRGYASSRDLGRYLATNYRASEKSNNRSASQELKDAFGGVAAFLNQQSHIFTTVKEPSDGDPKNYSFGIKLKDHNDAFNSNSNFNTNPRISGPTPNLQASTTPKQTMKRVDPKVDAHIEELLREYLHASGGEASSRNIGRYLAANAALVGQEDQGSTRWANAKGRNTALKQLKECYGSLAMYLNAKEDVFMRVSDNFQNGQGEFDQPSPHSFGVRLKS